MAMDKHDILKESTKKLLALKVSDDEIVSNLRDIGVSPREARQILNETKKEMPASQRARLEQQGPSAMEELKRAVQKQPAGIAAPRPVIVVPPRVEAPKAARASTMPLERAMRPQIQETAPESFSSQPSFQEPVRAVPQNTDIAKLWEKGILATIDAKLDEMERLKAETTAFVEKVSRDAVDKEIKKMQVVFDSQKTLMMDKINSQLDEKSENVTEVVRDKIEELKKIDALTRDALSRMESQKKENAKAIAEMDTQVSSLERTKSALIREMNTEVIKSRSEIEDFIQESRKKRDEMQTRINRAIELESKIREGLLQEAKSRIDKMALAKNAELTDKVERRINELEGLEQRLNPDEIKAMLVEMRSLKRELVTGLRKEAAVQMRTMLDRERQVWDRTIKAKANDMEELIKELDIDKLVTTMDDFHAFREQFLSVIKKNVVTFNMAKEELAKEMVERQKVFNLHISQIDLKIKELDDFERNFAKEMGLALDKLTENRARAAKKSRAKPAKNSGKKRK
ncbi:MAG: hypothetical protein ABH854_00295 [Candidatus Diapherotrites archaeon]|nr:hypothetical protein [Candidatus Micrarchaeota archaeon]MBU1939410.1 hypothetical protein [Candidatus Micrarchaeota archaeon]